MRARSFLLLRPLLLPPVLAPCQNANSPLSSFENSNCSIVPAKAWRRSFVLVPVRCSRFSPVLKAQDALFRLGVLSHPSVVERRVHRRLLLSPPATNSREMRQTRLFGIAQYDDSTGVSRSWREATRRRRRRTVAGTDHRATSILFRPQSASRREFRRMEARWWESKCSRMGVHLRLRCAASGFWPPSAIPASRAGSLLAPKLLHLELLY